MDLLQIISCPSTKLLMYNFDCTLLCYFAAGAPLIGFERTAQDNGNLLAIREGGSLELCVVLLSGTLTSETAVQIFTSGAVEELRKRETQAIGIHR